MSKKIILNDNEVVFNEDVEQGIDWKGRDLARLLEGLLQATFGQLRDGTPTDPGAGSVAGGAILSGLEMTWTTSNLDVTITPGTAIFSMGGSDTTVDGAFQLASSETDTVLSLPVASPTNYRWDLIEVSASQVTVSETRDVLSSGPLRTLSPTAVDKTRENQLQFRVRSGTPAALAADALLPALQPDPAWLPLFAVRVEPAMIRLLGIGVQNAHSFDLRKMFSRVRSDVDFAHGFQYPVTLSISSGFISSHRNWVQMGNYNSPMGVGFYINTTIGATGRNPFPTRPLANVNLDKAVGLSLSVDTWYYAYAFRPHENSGYTSMFVSDVGPNTATGSPTGRMAATPIILPAPFPAESTAPTQYLGAFRLAQSGSSFLPRGFRQNSGYVSHGSVSRSGLAGAVFSHEIINATFPVGSTTVSLNAIGDGILTVPPHCRMARIHFEWNGGGAPSGVTIYSYEDYALFTFSLAASEKLYVTLDVPLDFSSSGVKDFDVEVTGGPTASSRAYVLGYYEEMP